jgi:hypothetical protein
MLTRKTMLSTPAQPAPTAPAEGPREGPDDDPPPESPAENATEAALLATSRQTLDQTPARVLQFLQGVGTKNSIRAQLWARGYTAKVHARGWRLLRATGGFFDDDTDHKDDGEADDAAVRNAITEIDAWDEPGFRIINASLRARHPVQHTFLTRNLKSGTGAEAVNTVATLLDRLDALEGSPDREPTRQADHAALATLAERGIDKEERTRLRSLVERAQAFDEHFDDPAKRAENEKRMREARVELRLWFEEWSEIARVTLKRRVELIRLGLASRRPRRAAGEPGDDGDDDEGEVDGAAV